MEADWYEDPLGRFDGRFFDGEQWTAKVSKGGVQAIDPDFPPGTSAGNDGSTSEFSSAEPDPAIEPIAQHEASSPTQARSELRVSSGAESPARVVAVLDDSVARVENGAGPSGGSSGVDGATSNGATSNGASPWSRAMLLAIPALIAAVVVGLLVVLGGNEDPTVNESVDLDAEQEARVEDLVEGGFGVGLEPEEIEALEADTPANSLPTNTVFDPADAVQVGSTRVVNGVSLLQELEDWHEDFAADRGVALGPESGCWFGQVGGAAEQNAHCGPVAGADAQEYLFDSVPLRFDDADAGQVAQPVLEAPAIDARLPNSVALVGADGTSPPLGLPVPGRGGRTGTN